MDNISIISTRSGVNRDGWRTEEVRELRDAVGISTRSDEWSIAYQHQFGAACVFIDSYKETEVVASLGVMIWQGLDGGNWNPDGLIVANRFASDLAKAGLTQEAMDIMKHSAFAFAEGLESQMPRAIMRFVLEADADTFAAVEKVVEGMLADLDYDGDEEEECAA